MSSAQFPSCRLTEAACLLRIVGVRYGHVFSGYASASDAAPDTHQDQGSLASGDDPRLPAPVPLVRDPENPLASSSRPINDYRSHGSSSIPIWLARGVAVFNDPACLRGGRRSNQEQWLRSIPIFWLRRPRRSLIQTPAQIRTVGPCSSCDRSPEQACVPLLRMQLRRSSSVSSG